MAKRLSFEDGAGAHHHHVLRGDALGPEDSAVCRIVEGLPSLAGFARRLISQALAPALDEDDLLQECFLCAVARLDEIAGLGPGETRSWLRRLLRQIARNRRRAREREEKRLREKGCICVGGADAHDDPDCRFERLRATLHSLSYEDALLVVLVQVKDWAICDAAKKLDLCPAEASRRLCMLKEQIRDFFQTQHELLP